VDEAKERYLRDRRAAFAFAEQHLLGSEAGAAVGGGYGADAYSGAYSAPAYSSETAATSAFDAHPVPGSASELDGGHPRDHADASFGGHAPAGVGHSDAQPAEAPGPFHVSSPDYRPLSSSAAPRAADSGLHAVRVSDLSRASACADAAQHPHASTAPASDAPAARSDAGAGPAKAAAAGSKSWTIAGPLGADVDICHNCRKPGHRVRRCQEPCRWHAQDRCTRQDCRLVHG
jgi:hypothetical protein